MRFFKSSYLIALIMVSGAFFGVQAEMGGNYDIGGGNNDFSTIISAMSALTTQGMNAPVNFNVFTGTYRGQVTISSTIAGLSAANPLVIQAAPGQNPRVVNTVEYGASTGNGFFINGADYITIKNMEIDSCSGHGIRVFNGSNVDSAKYITIEGNYLHNCGYDFLVGGGILLTMAKYSKVLSNEVQAHYSGISLCISTDCIVANNMVYNCEGKGIKCQSSGRISYCYNSVFINSNGPDNCAFNLFDSDFIYIKNNILFNQSSGLGDKCAIIIDNPVVTMQVFSDYNCLYAPNGRVGWYSGNFYPTLLSWQTATDLDMHSISANPLYLSVAEPFDLHIDTSVLSPVNSAGRPNGRITSDFDGDTRNGRRPDIGADEFTPADGIIAEGNLPYALEPPALYNLINISPNPFNSSSTIRYSLQTAGNMRLSIYDTLGREVGVLKNGFSEPGNYSAEWNAENLPSGIYFVRLQQGNRSEVKKVVLMK